MPRRSRFEMEKQHAKAMRDLAPGAITDLTGILAIGREHVVAEEMEPLRYAVGRVIGRIQTDILDDICGHHPELDDLR